MHNTYICWDKAECVLPGKCWTDNVVYWATVSTDNATNTHALLTAGELKTKYQKHKLDSNILCDKNDTTLSSHVLKLKLENKAYQIDFEIVGRAAPFSAVSGRCNLCIREKYEIIFNPEKATLNSRNELFSTCRHKATALLVKRKRKIRPRGRWPCGTEFCH